MNDIMVDLETLDNVATSAIVAIGAVQCDLTTGETGETFYRVVELEGQVEKGLTISAGTLYWWLEQSEQARKEICSPRRITLDQMCIKFNLWLQHLGNPSGLRMWGNGCSFDNAILRHAYRKCNQELGIKFWNDRDVRTLLGFYPKSMFEKWKKDNMRVGAHNAIQDCKYQVAYCSQICKDLGVKELG